MNILMKSSYVTKKLAEEKVFKDPIHKYVHVKDQLIWDLIKLLKSVQNDCVLQYERQGIMYLIA
jgi:hypothetical protein